MGHYGSQKRYVLGVGVAIPSSLLKTTVLSLYNFLGKYKAVLVRK